MPIAALMYVERPGTRLPSTIQMRPAATSVNTGRSEWWLRMSPQAVKPRVFTMPRSRQRIEPGQWTFTGDVPFLAGR